MVNSDAASEKSYVAIAISKQQAGQKIAKSSGIAPSVHGIPVTSLTLITTNLYKTYSDIKWHNSCSYSFI